jgi:hypothetical protein
LIDAAGLVWWQRGQAYWGGVQAASDVLGLLFFMLLFPSMRALFRALFTFPNEQRMLMKARLLNCHSVLQPHNAVCFCSRAPTSSACS